MTTETNKIDELGYLMAQIANLEAKAELIKNEIKNQGEGYYEGSLFKACVTLSQRNIVDNKAVFKAYSIPAEFLAQHTKSTAVITLKLTGRE
jgi:hypothetical protein